MLFFLFLHENIHVSCGYPLGGDSVMDRQTDGWTEAFMSSLKLFSST